MTVYIAVSFQGHKELEQELQAVKTAVIDAGFIPFVFVEQYSFSPAEEKAMMQTAMQEIDRCAILIAALSHKAIGVGLEAGYAKGKGKPVIYLRRQDAEHSTTVSGISDEQVIYNDMNSLQAQLNQVLKAIKEK